MPYQLVAYVWHVAIWIYTSLKCTTKYYVCMYVFTLLFISLFSTHLPLLSIESFAGFSMGFSKSHLHDNLTRNRDTSFIQFSSIFLCVSNSVTLLLWSNSLSSIIYVYLTEFLASQRISAGISGTKIKSLHHNQVCCGMFVTRNNILAKFQHNFTSNDVKMV